MNIFFRCDSSIDIGTGHIMRCLTLADGLRSLGANVRFVSRELKGNISNLIETRGYILHRLPFQSNGKASIGNHLNPASILSVPLDQEIDESNKIFRENAPIEWIIADHYALGEVWEKSVRPTASHIMVIDDLADRKHDCEILLDQNYYDTMETRYNKLVPDHCMKFLGPKYALLRREFALVRKNLRKRDGIVRRILIFFGGSDRSNETEKSLDAIEMLDRLDIEIDVVTGASNPNSEKIRRRCAAILNCNYYHNVQTMVELIAKADLAIGACGTSTWERCCLGLPSITYSIAQNQIDIGRTAGLFGLTEYIGESINIDHKMIFNRLKILIENKNLCQSMSNKCFQITDGTGCLMVAKELYQR